MASTNAHRPRSVHLRIAGALALLAAFTFCTAQTKAVGRDRISPPVFVDFKAGSLDQLLGENRADVVATYAAQVRAAAADNPGRVVAIRFTDLRLRYQRLNSAQKAAARRLSPKDARGSEALVAAAYEQGIAALLSEVMQQAREGTGRHGALLSVYDLPITRTRSAEVNENYIRLAAHVDAFVAADRFLARNAEPVRLDDSLSVAKLIAGDRPVLYQVNSAWEATASPSIKPSASASVETTIANGAQVWGRDELIAMLLHWGTADSSYDLTGDGTVNVLDLLELIGLWGDPLSSTSHVPLPPGIGRFVDEPNPYAQGSGAEVAFETLADAPPSPNVVFQVWSLETGSVEGAFADYTPPFAYPAAALNEVTPGAGEIQAIVRDATNDVVEVIKFATMFVAMPSTGSGGGSGSGGSTGSGGSGGSGSGSGSGSSGGGSSGSGGASGGGSTGGSSGSGTGGSGGGGPAPDPVITLRKAAGMAPFTAHVHALESSFGGGDEMTALVRWDMGDPDGDYNELIGWNAGHIYEEPGAYTITLRVTNESGAYAETSVNISVLADTRQDIYISLGGNDANDGRSPATPIRTITRAIQLMADDTTVHFRRGATYDTTSSLVIEHDNVVVDAYGSGAKPVLRWQTSNPYAAIIKVADSCDGVTVRNIEFTSPYAPNANIVRAMAVRGANLTVNDCKFGKISYAMNSGGGGVNGWLTQNNVAGAIGAYYAWSEGEDHVHLGNTVADSVSEHVLRFSNVHRALIAHNDLTNTNKTTMWCMLGDHIYIHGNTLREGRFRVGPNFAVSSPNERFRFVVFERNRMINDGIEMLAGAEHITVRCNLFDFNAGTVIGVGSYNSQWDRNVNHVNIYHNTALNNHATYGRFLRIGGGAADLNVANNMYASTKLNAAWGAANVHAETGTLETMSFANNMWANPNSGSHHHFLSGGGLNAGQWSDLQQTAGESYHTFIAADLDENVVPQFNATMAQPAPGVFFDLHGNERPLVGTVTAGAVEGE